MSILKFDKKDESAYFVNQDPPTEMTFGNARKSLWFSKFIPPVGQNVTS
jgi:hypothetical protein